jgi:hypothetical protein
MRLILALVFLISVVQSAAIADPLGKKLGYAKSPSGDPQVGLIYAYDSSFTWRFQYTSNISALDMQTFPEEGAYWNAYDLSTGAWLLSWTLVPRDFLYIGSLVVNDSASVKKILPSLKHLAVAFSKTPQADPRLYLSVQDVCEHYPQHVKNLTDTSAPACEIPPL